MTTKIRLWFVYTFSNFGLWQIFLRTKGLRLYLPAPTYVLMDLLVSIEDLCEVILPRIGKPNYARLLREVFGALLDVPANLPLIDIRTDDVDIILKRVQWGGN